MADVVVNVEPSSITILISNAQGPVGPQGASGSVTYGPTSERPEIEDVPIGYPYFDTTLGFFITSNGETWVSTAGQEV